MSAQDYEMMMLTQTRPITRRGASALKLFGEGLARLWREATCRHHLWKLTELDDEQLLDYGISRDELISALQAPLTQRASLQLLSCREQRAQR